MLLYFMLAALISRYGWWKPLLKEVIHMEQHVLIQDSASSTQF